MIITKQDFGDDFIWGISSAAYQVEGSGNSHGKGASIWDEFVKKRNRIYKNANANIACDFYNLYPLDISILYQLGIANFRFSLSWPRILPNGIGAVNPKGIDYYDRLIDFCLELGIAPWVTLYHWDLPHVLEQKGGWTNRDIIQWFSEFVSVCINKYGDRVKHWMVLNEPIVFTGAGYFLGVHAPGRKGVKNFLKSVHHAALCQAEGARVIRSIRSDMKVGTTHSFTHIEPFSAKDQAAQIRVDAIVNRLFIEPLLGLGYPMVDLPFLLDIEKYILQDDMKRLEHSMDFIGVQNYTREVVKHNYFMPYIKAKLVAATKRNVETTVMNWEVYPKSIYYILKKLQAYSNMPELIVTESGAAFADEVMNGEVNDIKRIHYIENHLSMILAAKKEGVNVNGYFVWTLTDNFEWAEGYKPRFGLVYVDHENQARIIKASGKWYGNFVKG